MAYRRCFLTFVLTVFTLLNATGCTTAPTPSAQFETLETIGTPTARHEAAFVEHKGKLYLIGGRRINPVDVFDPLTRRWRQKATPELELHHVQAVSYGDAIYLIGAMTGPYPNEVPLDRVLKYLPAEDRFEWGATIPEHRRRGAAGVAVYNERIYIVGGITNGHVGGAQPWLDEFDPRSGQWRALADAPIARDHLQAAVAGDRLYVFAGRRTSQGTGQVIDLTERRGNVYDFKRAAWLASTDALTLPTERAGNMAIAWGDQIFVAGGESATQVAAHSEVEVFDVRGNRWRTHAPLNRGRHGTGFAIVDGYLYTASGCGNRGGKPELTSLERLRLPRPKR
ncbi:MAG: Kelch repeat-containing protein [Gammaproteobacteria bacterium]